MYSIQPKAIPTFRFVSTNDEGHREYYEGISFLIKKYGCPVTKVSDDFSWIRIYFDIPLEAKEQFLNEEQALGRDTSEQKPNS